MLRCHPDSEAEELSDAGEGSAGLAGLDGACGAHGGVAEGGPVFQVVGKFDLIGDVGFARVPRVGVGEGVAFDDRFGEEMGVGF